MLDNIKLFVFDLGGTLMEYKGMHLSWAGYYKSSFEYVNERLGLGLTDQQISTSVQIFTDYNPAVNPREKEIDPKIIFEDIIKGWGTNLPISKIIDVFFESLHLEPENMVMIGDTSRDVNAAKNIGCHSILINRSGKPSQDFGQEHTVTNAMEILDLIQI